MIVEVSTALVAIGFLLTFATLIAIWREICNRDAATKRLIRDEFRQQTEMLKAHFDIRWDLVDYQQAPCGGPVHVTRGELAHFVDILTPTASSEPKIDAYYHNGRRVVATRKYHDN